MRENPIPVQPLSIETHYYVDNFPKKAYLICMHVVFYLFGVVSGWYLAQLISFAA